MAASDPLTRNENTASTAIAPAKTESLVRPLHLVMKRSCVGQPAVSEATIGACRFRAPAAIRRSVWATPCPSRNHGAIFRHDRLRVNPHVAIGRTSGARHHHLRPPHRLPIAAG
jgi:hypothetical protein